MIIDATMNGRHNNSAASSASPISWANTLHDMAHDDKHVGNSKSRIHTTPAKADSPLIKISRDELRSLIQVEVKSSVKTAQREEMRNMSRNFVEETLCNFFTTRYCAATNGITDSFFSFEIIVATVMIHRGGLHETLKLSFNSW